MRPEAFIELSKAELDYFQKHAPFKKDWLGHRIVGIDGSTLCLPDSKKLEKHFGVLDPASARKTIMANISTAFDVCNQLILDAIISPYGTAETTQAQQHLENLLPGDIAVFDRNYASFWLMGLLKRKGIHFCFRLTKSWGDAARLMNEEGEADIDWNPKRNSKHKCEISKELGLPNHLENLRLVSIDLGNGEKEVLATDLTDREKYPPEKIKELYNLRWRCEENYKVLKQISEMEYFSAKSVQEIKQDFFARIFMVNMASILTSQLTMEEVQKINKSRAKSYQISKTQSIAKVKDFLSDIFQNINLQDILLQIKKLLLGCLEIIRPKRKFARKIRYFRHKYLNNKGI